MFAQPAFGQNAIIPRFTLTTAERALLASIEAELRVLRLDGDRTLDHILPDMRRLVGTRTLLLVTPVERGHGLEIERFHSAGFEGNGEPLRREFNRFFKTAPHRYAWYNAVRPEREQRNRLLEPHDLASQDEFESSAVYQRVLVPTGLHRDRQPRILLCDGPSLLGWFGAFHGGPVELRHRRMLARFAPIIRRRLRVERRLDSAPLFASALDAALERLGAPAFVLRANGSIALANAAGCALFDKRPDVRAALRDRIAGRPATLAFDVTPLCEYGAPAAWLAILPATSPDDRIHAAVARAAQRWKLTARQRLVLEHIVHGHANATIAALLEISVRAVELHVTALFDRAGADGRGALVARVLLDG